jgi:hypothetical protein
MMKDITKSITNDDINLMQEFSKQQRQVSLNQDDLLMIASASQHSNYQ